jgi:hypothetical protein
VSARLKAALRAIQDTLLVAETFGLDEKVEVEQVAQLLMVALEECREILGTSPEQIYGRNVEVTPEWGFRYRISDKHEYTKVAPCAYLHAIQWAKELKEYNGEVTVEILRRVTMASDWMVMDVDELAARES